MAETGEVPDAPTTGVADDQSQHGVDAAPGVAAVSASGNAAVTPEPERVAIRFLGPDSAVVFGEPSHLSAIGTEFDHLPDAIARAVAVGNVALQGVFAAGQASGQLVRLTAESAAALKALGPMVDSSGAILGVVRDGGGQFAKVLRFTSAEGLGALASLGPALASLALQMQLQAISKQLDEVRRVADSIAQHQTDELLSSVEANIKQLSQVYRTLELTGTISAIDSAALTNLRKDLDKDVLLIGRKLDAGVTAIYGVARDDRQVWVRGLRVWGGRDRWAGDRLKILDAIDQYEKPLVWIDAYVQAQRALIMSEFLRVHQFIATTDPHLDVHRQESEERVRASVEQMHAKFERITGAIDHAGSGDWNSWIPPRNAWSAVDRRPDLTKRLEHVRELTRPVFDAVAQLSLSFGSPLQLP